MTIITYASFCSLTCVCLLDTVKYRTRQTVNISDSIPSDAMAAGVRFQWTQYQSNGASTDVWIIDDVIIGGRCGCFFCTLCLSIIIVVA